MEENKWGRLSFGEMFARRVGGLWRASTRAQRIAMPTHTYSTSVHYNKTINRLVKDRQIEQAFQEFESMKEKKLRPDVVTYSTLIGACGKTKNLNKAFELWKEMKGASIFPNVYTYTALIDACGKTQQLDKAFTLLQEM